MRQPIYVPRVGPVSKGAQLLLEAMRREGLSQEVLRAQMKLAKGVIGHWLRGTKRPGGPARSALFERFAIAPGDWDRETKKPPGRSAA